MSFVKQYRNGKRGASVPDAQMLIQISEFFEVPVDTLLGESIENQNNINEVAVQLALLNEQLANRSRNRRRLLRNIVIGIVIFLTLIILLNVIAVNRYSFQTNTSSTTTVEMIGILDEEEYTYTITYDEDGQVIEFIGDKIEGMETDSRNAQELQEAVKSYFQENGGSVTYAGD